MQVGLVLERTPFYAEQGGQAADTGSIASTGSRFAVHDTKARPAADVHPPTAAGGAACGAALATRSRGSSA